MQAIGHNKPPSDDEIFAARMLEQHGDLIKEAEDFARKRAKDCDSQEYAERLTNFIKKVSVIGGKLEKLRVAEKEPHLEAGKVVDRFFKRLTLALEQARRGAQEPLNKWLRQCAEEEARLRREAAEQIRREEEEKARLAMKLEDQGEPEAAQHVQEQADKMGIYADKLEASAAAPTAQLAQVKTETGASASLRTRWVGEVTSRAELDLNALRFHLPAAALQTAINAFIAAGGRELKGAKIHQVSEAAVR